MADTPKAPNPLKQARRDKREARAIRRFIKGYRVIGPLVDNERTMLIDMLELANARVKAATDALTALKADEAKQ